MSRQLKEMSWEVEKTLTRQGRCFQRLTGFDRSKAPSLRSWWHWQVITRRRSSQITGTLAVVMTTTVSKFIVLQVNEFFK